jgi:hypothetical protein
MLLLLLEASEVGDGSSAAPRGCDWLEAAVYSYYGAVIGRMLLYIPIEGLLLVGGCGIFLLRGCHWSEGAAYSY